MSTIAVGLGRPCAARLYLRGDTAHHALAPHPYGWKLLSWLPSSSADKIEFDDDGSHDKSRISLAPGRSGSPRSSRENTGPTPQLPCALWIACSRCLPPTSSVLTPPWLTGSCGHLCSRARRCETLRRCRPSTRHSRVRHAPSRCSAQDAVRVLSRMSRRPTESD